MSEDTGQILPEAIYRTEVPVINSAFEVPEKHLAVGPDYKQVTEGEYLVFAGRRQAGLIESSSRGHGDAKPWERVYERINRIRALVAEWRGRDYAEASFESISLLNHWMSQEAIPAFFCQLEAVETRIWLEEIAPHDEDGKKVLREIAEANFQLNPSLGNKPVSNMGVEDMPELHGTQFISRIATKMATGTGKTRTIAMLIVWMASRLENPVSDFLLLTPNKTVTSRLKELDPGDDDNIYDREGLFCSGIRPKIRITISHWQSFNERSNQNFLDMEPDKETKGVLARAESRMGGNFTSNIEKESPEEMLSRMLRNHKPLSNHKLHVINDEGHHCYLGQSSHSEDLEGRKWFEIIRVLKKNHWLHGVSDFSATPIYPDGRKPKSLKADLFPWTVSDFPLVEAVECGLTKTPRVPEMKLRKADVIWEPPTRKKRKSGSQAPLNLDSGDAKTIYRDYPPTRGAQGLHIEVQKNLAILVNHHLSKTRKLYQSKNIVFCIVSSSIRDAREFFKFIAGVPNDTSTIKWPEFSNLNSDGTVKDNPPTLLVHSRINKAGDTRGADDALLYEYFKKDGDGRSWRKILSERIESMFLTAGVKDKEGEHIRCIVSVDKLTEGWDCKTVTEIFGYRAFSSDLLCEQVTGRALRRTDYDIIPGTHYSHQLANLIGVPFSWMPVGKEHPEVDPPPRYWCRPVRNNRSKRITVPNLEGYRFRRGSVGVEYNPKLARDWGFRIDDGTDKIVVSFAGGVQEVLKGDLGVIGCSVGQVIWRVAEQARLKFIADQSVTRNQRWLMASMILASRKWYFDPRNKARGLEIACGLPELINAAAEELHRCCSRTDNPPGVEPVFPFPEMGPSKRDTGAKAFETNLIHQYPEVIKGDPELELKKFERNVAPCHSNPEVLIATLLEEKLSNVDAWARNLFTGKVGYSLRLEIPYRNPRNGCWQKYHPDFVARTKKGNHVVIEYKGDFPEKDEDLEAAKKRYTEEYWIPAVNDSNRPECSGNWVYCYVEDTMTAERKIAEALRLADKQRQAT